MTAETTEALVERARRTVRHIIESDLILQPDFTQKHVDDCPGCATEAALDALAARLTEAETKIEALEMLDMSATAAQWEGAYLAQKERVATLEAALTFYADGEKYLWSAGPPPKRGVIQAEDQGAVARAALAAQGSGEDTA